MTDEGGFTIVELLIAMSISLVVIFAGFQALDGFTAVSSTTQRRSDNTQRGRLEMDGLIRALRSQSCTGPGGTSLLAASGTSISFVTDLGDGTTAPEQRTVTYVAGSRALRESRYAGTRSGSTVTFASTPTKYGAELGDVEPDVTGPIFRYYRYDTSSPPRPTVEMTGTLSATDLASVAKIGVSFRVGAAAGKRDRAAGAVLSDEVFLRSVDPADPVPLPLCQ